MSFFTDPPRSISHLLAVWVVLLVWRVPAVLAYQTATPSRTQARSRLLINEIMPANVSTIVDPDYRAFADWIEIYNQGEEAVDLSNYTLTDDIRNPVKWFIPPGTTLPAGGYLLVWADGRDSDFHSSFRLSRDGEEVALYDTDGLLVDMVRFGDQAEDVSFGRTVDGASDWAFFQQPTPGDMNTGESVTNITQASAPEFSKAGGRYQTPQKVAISEPSPAAEIYYTLDGSRPTTDSILYQEPIQVSETTVVRARTFVDGLLASPIRTDTYLIGEQTQLPIISLVTDPAHLWDPDIGIYVDERIDTRKDWERPSTIALYEPEDSSGFQSEASIRLFGSSAIYLPQKSLAVFIRDPANDDRLTIQLFPDGNLNEYSAFILRSGSDDWASTMLRDAIGQQALAGHVDLSTQAFRPALLFVNGSYFGIHHVREKLNEDYLDTHYGADREQVDLLSVGYDHDVGGSSVNVLSGDASDYKDLAAFAESHDLAVPENYAAVQARLNTDNFIDYIIVESYTGNTSWHRNRKLWRAQYPLDRWDFLVYDLDRGFGHPYTNMLQDIMNLDSLFGALLTNETFKNQFIQRFAHHLNVTYEPERMVALIDDLSDAIAPEIERHRAHWPVAAWWAENYETEALHNGRPAIPQLPAWEDEIAYIQQFVRVRPPALRQHLVEAFSLSGTQYLTLDVNQPEGGKILVEGLSLPYTPFTGVYFRDIPLQLTAVAEPGYRFGGWQGAVTSREKMVSLVLTNNETITAVFEPIGQPNPWLDLRQPRSWAAGAGLVLLVMLVELLQFAHRRKSS